MKTINLILAAFLLSVMCTGAQTAKSTMELLMQNTWMATFDIGNNETIIETYKYTLSELISMTLFKESEEIEVTYSYYLSNSIETVFDWTKVGNVSTGKYLIEINKFDVVSVYEIIKLTDTELVLSSIDMRTDPPQKREDTTTFTVSTVNERP